MKNQTAWTKTAAQNVPGRVKSAQPGQGAKNIWNWIQDRVRRLGRKPSIGLALGSGAAWGVAHIGVLSAFQELNIPVSYLSGSSSGSFVGALYAGGILGRDLEACGQDYSWRDVGRLTYFPKMGLAANDRMASYLKSKIGNPQFEDLQTPLYVVATNLNTGQLQVFKKGPVIPAVRASCAIPGIFAPVEIEGELYCDGGVLSKIPCRVLREVGADLVIGVELTSVKRKAPPGNIFEVISRALDIALTRQIETDIASADLIIRPNVDDLRDFAFDQNDALIERGRKAAMKQVSQWKQLSSIAPKPRTETVP